MKYEYLRRRMFLDNLRWFEPCNTFGRFQMPYIHKVLFCPDQLIRFPEAMKLSHYSAGIHFFIDDYRIEPLWRNIEKYIPKLKKYSAVLSPDFSLYTDMSVAQQIWNTYRSRLVASVMQRMGLTVIPTVSWADAESFSFCFDGIEKNGIVAVSTIGTKKNVKDKKLFSEGIRRMITVLSPHAIIIYGSLPEYDFGSMKIFHFPACKKNSKMLSYMEVK